MTKSYSLFNFFRSIICCLLTLFCFNVVTAQRLHLQLHSGLTGFVKTTLKSEVNYSGSKPLSGYPERLLPDLGLGINLSITPKISIRGEVRYHNYNISFDAKKKSNNEMVLQATTSNRKLTFSLLPEFKNTLGKSNLKYYIFAGPCINAEVATNKTKGYFYSVNNSGITILTNFETAHKPSNSFGFMGGIGLKGKIWKNIGWLGETRFATTSLTNQVFDYEFSTRQIILFAGLSIDLVK
jgi:Outer membrane protein beta-barrel domain